jgi:glycosyltransferase involved in cell wall biosynthesis
VESKDMNSASLSARPDGSESVSTAPAVSVVVPTRGRSWLRDAILSVLCQTFEDFEIIVSDSSGGAVTRVMVEEFRDPRLRYRAAPGADIRLNHSGAFAEARGRFVAFLHDDDVWEPQFLARLMQGLEANPSCVLAFCDQTAIDDSGAPVAWLSDAATRHWRRQRLAAGPHQPFWRLLIDQSIPMCAGTLFRRVALKPEDFSARAGTAVDMWLSFVLCRTGLGACYVRERLVRYRYHAGSDSALFDDPRLGTIWFWTALVEDPAIGRFRREALVRRSRARQRTAAVLLRQGGRRSAMRLAMEAWADGPGPRALAVLALTFLPQRLTALCVRIYGAAAGSITEWRRWSVSAARAPMSGSLPAGTKVEHAEQTPAARSRQ